ncbi:MAG: pyridoxamine 5'-phosphate oxidase [Rhodospirillaceae bacterium]|nr:pyridoxamine 5'-phosphate oxidase [Rhodospirillaceae bacterium]
MTDSVSQLELPPGGVRPWEEPFATARAWLAEAEGSEPNDPNAMALASVGADGMPSVRMVLLKEIDQRGFVFYTNFESRKGRQILASGKAALVLHWKSLRRQIRVEGEVEQVSDAEADAYYQSRHRSSQIGAWASQQSRPLESRFELEKRVALFAAKYAIGTVPRPPHWSGFRIRPRYFEFWEDRPFRLHDRLVYHPVDGGDAPAGWRTEKLYP